MKNSISYYRQKYFKFEYFLGFLITFCLFTIGLSLRKTLINNVEYTEQQISKSEVREVQEIDNLKMTISTFETVISTLEADNLKLSEIIHKHNWKVGGWELFGLLFLTSVSSSLALFLVIIYNSTNPGFVATFKSKKQRSFK